MEKEFVALAQNNESIQGQRWCPALCNCVNSGCSKQFWVSRIPTAGLRSLLYRLFKPSGFGMEFSRIGWVYGLTVCVVPFSTGLNVYVNKNAL